MKKTSDGWTDAQFVNSFTAAELVFPQASVIGLLLFDSTASSGEIGHRDQPFRFRLTAQRARAIAKALIELADEIEGAGRQRQ
jgi:hypothetical protein